MSVETVTPSQLASRINEDIQQDIDKSLSRKNLKGAEVKVLEKMDEIKNRETLSGKSPADGGRWNNTYNRQYANRKKGGSQSPVTLRQNQERIEQTEIQSSSKRSTMSFRDGKIGQIFYLHDQGEARGGKFRQVYPGTDKEVPEELDITAENAVFTILQ